MKKNIIIAAVIFLNLILLMVLIYVGVTWSPSGKASADATGAAQDKSAEGGPEEFTFKAPGRFVGDEAPPVVNRALTITATFDALEQGGVIVAQGGLAHGYALYVQDGELFFVLRRLNVLTTISGGKVGAGRQTATAMLTRAGELSVAFDGKAPATGKAAGVITMQPIDGLDIGADRGAPVGIYEVPNSFGGTIEVVSVKTAP